MDNLQSLLEQGEYKKVLEKTNESHDPLALFSRAAAYLGLGRDEDVLQLIAKEHESMETKLPQLIKLHIELLIELQRYDEAYEAMDHYNSLPYFSQESEEMLKEYPGRIRTAEKQLNNNDRFSEKEIIASLTGKDEGKILITLEYIAHHEPLKYLDSIKKILIGTINEFVKTFALLILVSEKYEEEVEFIKGGIDYHLVPYELDPPFEGPFFEEFAKQMESHGEDPYIVNIASEIFHNYLMAVYPDDVYGDISDLLIEALFVVAKTYLGLSYDLVSLAQKAGQNPVKIRALADSIDEIIKTSQKVEL